MIPLSYPLPLLGLSKGRNLSPNSTICTTLPSPEFSLSRPWCPTPSSTSLPLIPSTTQTRPYSPTSHPDPRLDHSHRVAPPTPQIQVTSSGARPWTGGPVTRPLPSDHSPYCPSSVIRVPGPYRPLPPSFMCSPGPSPTPSDPPEPPETHIVGLPGPGRPGPRDNLGSSRRNKGERKGGREGDVLNHEEVVPPPSPFFGNFPRGTIPDPVRLQG